jgi:hypothetical protein
MAKNKLSVHMKKGCRTVTFNVAPNQKVVEIHKQKLKSVMNIQFNRKAQATLSLQAYALYMHFMCNLHGYKELLSPDQVTKTTALGEKAYYKAVKELIEKEYLVQTKNQDIANYYVFYEDPSLCPQAQNQNSSEANGDEPNGESTL